MKQYKKGDAALANGYGLPKCVSRFARNAKCLCLSGGMVDASDSKSDIRKGVRVRVSPWAPEASVIALIPDSQREVLWSGSKHKG